MKKTHIAIIIGIAIAIGLLISSINANDFSSYKSFEVAKQNPGQEITVVGVLNLEDGINFNPKKVMLSFNATDKEGNVSKVYYNQPKPQDFEKSEEITMKGFATDTAFIASEILMKCPSKYNEQNEIEGNADSYTDAVTEN